MRVFSLLMMSCIFFGGGSASYSTSLENDLFEATNRLAAAVSRLARALNVAEKAGAVSPAESEKAGAGPLGFLRDSPLPPAILNGPYSYTGSVQISPETDALLVIDGQNSFMMPEINIPGTGELAVNNAQLIVPHINALAPLFSKVAVSKDWHPANHISFAKNHWGAEPFSTIAVPSPYRKGVMLQQKMWPPHCQQGTPGADLYPGLAPQVRQTPHVILKGSNPLVDSYSAFKDAGGDFTNASLLFRRLGVRRLFMVGLATDYCVISSAVDAALLGFDVYLIWDACKGIRPELRTLGTDFPETLENYVNGTVEKTRQEVRSHGGKGNLTLIPRSAQLWRAI